MTLLLALVACGDDDRDYHFMIRLTDRAGWQELRSVAIEVE